jgi:hypothetical protein
MACSRPPARDADNAWSSGKTAFLRGWASNHSLITGLTPPPAGTTQLIDRASHGANDWDIEHRLLMADGSTRHVRAAAHAAVVDLTTSKRAEEARQLRLTCLSTP